MNQSTTSPKPKSRPSLLLDYLRLFRAPNVFTAMADVAMGFLFVHGTMTPAATLFCLLAASSLLYTAGMVLNDVFDVEIDARERPNRPLPSGRIPLSWARGLGFGMLLFGVMLGWLGGYLVPSLAAIPWRCGAIASLLAIFVIAYDGVLKKTWLGPLGMGACRFLNVLLGMSAAATTTNNLAMLGFDQTELIVASGIGLYIVGVTIFARGEADISNRLLLSAGLFVMVLGITLLALFPQFDQHGRLTLQPHLAWPALLLLIAISIGSRSLAAILEPTPRRVQTAVKQAILSLIVLDASVCLAISQRGELYWPLAVLALLAPTLILGKWVYST